MSMAKYLVLRRDGTLPPWPYFVLGAADPAAWDTFAFYVERCRELGYSQQYLDELSAIRLNFVKPNGPERRPDDGKVWPGNHPIVFQLLKLHAGGRGAPPIYDLNDVLYEHVSERFQHLFKAAHTWAFSRLLGLAARDR